MGRLLQTSDATNSDELLVHVLNQDEHEIQVKLKQDTPMEKLFAAVICRTPRTDLEQRKYRFIYNGRRIRSRDTPATLHMKHSDW
eukprot:CAMPEP_0184706158 /NCGR_PEP_ID=MMETSP0313-20130426/36616_1 /TAXON_ID=2792 /ORGANISM="Porphyridium aerugineum, Strain SAG 1380-2" /LENGTH=84 /DNA_ID=CAMNT_0027167705 /DNA_START=538 /DNA_END=789 /DNA_ORIENTATION=-